MLRIQQSRRTVNLLRKKCDAITQEICNRRHTNFENAQKEEIIFFRYSYCVIYLHKLLLKLLQYCTAFLLQ